MKKSFLFITITFLYLIPQSVLAANIWLPDMYVKKIRVHDNNLVYVSFADANNRPPMQTCDSWGTQIKFSISSDFGKAWLEMLKEAKLQTKKVQIWYSPSTNIDSIEADCSNHHISLLSTLAN